jgi:hypothetical protein
MPQTGLRREAAGDRRPANRRTPAGDPAGANPSSSPRTCGSHARCATSSTTTADGATLCKTSPTSSTSAVARSTGRSRAPPPRPGRRGVARPASGASFWAKAEVDPLAAPARAFTRIRSRTARANSDESGSDGVPAQDTRRDRARADAATAANRRACVVEPPQTLGLWPRLGFVARRV